MWSAWRRSLALYVGSGRVLLERATGSAVETSAEECDAGTELDLADRLAHAARSARFTVLLGSGWITLHSVQRVDGVWREAERNRAALGVARLDPAVWHAVTIDPSPRSSNWLLCALRRDRHETLLKWRDRMRGRVTRIAAYSTTLMSTTTAPRGESHLTAVLEAGDLSWSVATAHSLLAAGIVRAIRREQGRAEVDRLALAHGIKETQRRVFELLSTGGSAPATHTDTAVPAGVPLRALTRILDFSLP